MRSNMLHSIELLLLNRVIKREIRPLLRTLRSFSPSHSNECYGKKYGKFRFIHHWVGEPQA